MKNRIDSSRQRTPWDDKDDITIVENFIQYKYKDNYNLKHPKLINTEEAKVINSIIIDNCRYCDSDKIKKNGFTKNGIQRYYCYECKRSFSVNKSKNNFTISNEDVDKIKKYIEQTNDTTSNLRDANSINIILKKYEDDLREHSNEVRNLNKKIKTRDDRIEDLENRLEFADDTIYMLWC